MLACLDTLVNLTQPNSRALGLLGAMMRATSRQSDEMDRGAFSNGPI